MLAPQLARASAAGGDHAAAAEDLARVSAAAPHDAGALCALGAAHAALGERAAARRCLEAAAAALPSDVGALTRLGRHLLEDGGVTRPGDHFPAPLSASARAKLSPAVFEPEPPFVPPVVQRRRARPRRKAVVAQVVQADVRNLQPLQSRRWTFDDMQKAKKNLQPEATPQPMKTSTQVFVMMPLDIIAVGELKEGQEASFILSPSHDAKLLDRQLATLEATGATGIMLDVWWGICERRGPKEYDFSAYMELFKKARKHGLKVQAVMSFHAGGGNVGDGSTDIPLPLWVIEAGEGLNDEIFYTDKRGGRDHECLSLGCDHERVLAGRTPIEVYRDFVSEFADHCRRENLWGTVLTEICMGLGPCGELRYPAYQEAGGKWSYFGQTMGADGAVTVQRGIPGIGEFQCYDQYMLDSLRAAAEAAGHPEWASPPRDGAGSYDFAPWETEFFALSNSGGWLQPYGKFFLEWYSGELVRHAEDVLDAVLPVVREDVVNANSIPPVDVAIKVAGIHWWYKSRSHAAEMTAGYYNYLERDGYEPIARLLKPRKCGFSFTCIEMSNGENPDLRHCSPEDLVAQVIAAGEKHGVQLLAENALEGGIYNADALERMASKSKHFDRITLLRLRASMFTPDDNARTGLRVKQPLAGFLNRFRQEHKPPPMEASFS
ncbi:hypothetical protein WJX81_003713 [Elliptochloris bilobata]|uniref:Beta-amylase n=1 Tax=Elliptochloris bilobata TaxID=381761 RepID=A0AAW1S858_9CHLO